MGVGLLYFAHLDLNHQANLPANLSLDEVAWGGNTCPSLEGHAPPLLKMHIAWSHQASLAE